MWSLKCFPDWEWYNIKVFETDDPNHFWVECDGHGKILFPGYPEGYYENHFLHSFELDFKFEGMQEVVFVITFGISGEKNLAVTVAFDPEMIGVVGSEYIYVVPLPIGKALQ